MTAAPSELPSTVNYRVMTDYTRLPIPETPLNDRLTADDDVLLLRLSAIGDVVRLLPAVRYLRTNGFDGTLGWAVQPPCDELLRTWPGVDRVHRIDRDRWWAHPVRLVRQFSALRRWDYDWCFDVHGLLKSAAVGLASGAGRRVGFDARNSKEMNHRFQHATIDPLPPSLPRILKYVQLLRPFTPDFTFDRDHLVPEPPTIDPASEAVREAAGDRPLLVHPRTSHARYGRRKEWGVRNFRGLIRRLLEDREPAFPVYITWGPDERTTAQRIAEGFPDTVRPAPRTGELSDLAYLIQHARLVVSGDTAPCHISDVVGTPLVALFGSSDHGVSGPLLTDYRLITTRGRESETGDIPVNRVYRAILDLLDSPLRSRTAPSESSN